MTVFAAGTATFFKQSSAPTGWTKSTSYDDATLRVVSGSAGSGGSLGLSTTLSSGTWNGTVSTPGFTTGSTTLSAPQIPSHTHLQTGASGNVPRSSAPASASLRFGYAPGGPINNGLTTTATGGGTGHSHTAPGQPVPFTGSPYNFSVSYVDVIMATKD